jgi:hypothetical protein
MVSNAPYVFAGTLVSNHIIRSATNGAMGVDIPKVIGGSF